MKRVVLAMAVLVTLLGCDGKEKQTDSVEPAAEASESLTKETDGGPVVATLSLTPAAPRIGDVLTLMLKVVADPGTRVTMPPFGEALGRFTVLKYTPRQSRDAEGREVLEQVYTLQAPGSGRQRIPRLRIEFVVADSEEERELLTEELPIEIESVIAATEVSGELQGIPKELDESPGIPPWVWPAVAVVILLIAGAWWRAQSAKKIREALAAQLGAFDRARERLEALSAMGAPSAEQTDDWYVELSSIVRRYLEDRQRLRAPELTTEEFLTQAQTIGVLGQGPRELLPEFLAQCDRVKFAGYRPSSTESERGLELARQILEQQEEFLETTARRAQGGEG